MEQTKRDCILASAAKAFTRFGFRKASVDEIAKDAGVGKGTVYLACDSKEDLFYQAVHRELRAWIGETARLVDPRKQADELLVEIASASARYLEAHPLVRELFEGKHAVLLPQWEERLEALRALGRQNVIEVLRLGIRQKVFRADLDVEELSTILQDLNMVSWAFHPRDLEDPAVIERRARVGLDLVLNGLRPRRS